MRPITGTDRVLVRTDKKIFTMDRNDLVASKDLHGMQHVALSADGKHFSALNAGKIKEFETQTRKSARVFFNPPNPITTLNYSSNGKYLLLGDSGPKICCFETKTGDKNLEITVNKHTFHYGKIRSLDFEGGRIHALFADKTRAAVSFDILDGTETGSNGGGESANFSISEMKVAPSGRWILEKNGNNINVSNYPPTKIFGGYIIRENSNLTGLQFTHDDLALAGITDKGDLYLWPNAARE